MGGLVVVGFGILFTLVSVFVYRSVIVGYTKSTVETVAEIIYMRETVEYRNRKPCHTFYATVQWYVGTKAYHSEETVSVDMYDQYDVGEQIMVSYNPDSPDTCHLLTDTLSFVLPFSFMLTGVITTLLGVWVTVVELGFDGVIGNILCLCIIGAGFFLVGLMMVGILDMCPFKGICKAEIVENEASSSRGIRKYLPTLRYIVRNEEYITPLRLPLARYESWKVGSVLTVRYDKGSPDRILLHKNGIMYRVAGALLMLIGMGFVVLGLSPLA